jgi:hypothetical protein
MTDRARESGWAVRRVLENAGILSFASLLVMSLALGRYSGALVWSGALTVFFAHAWQARSQRRLELLSDAGAAAVPYPRHFDALRWLGIALAFAGTALSL